MANYTKTFEIVTPPPPPSPPLPIQQQPTTVIAPASFTSLQSVIFHLDIFILIVAAAFLLATGAAFCLGKWCERRKVPRVNPLLQQHNAFYASHRVMEQQAQ